MPGVVTTAPWARARIRFSSLCSTHVAGALHDSVCCSLPSNQGSRYSIQSGAPVRREAMSPATCVEKGGPETYIASKGLARCNAITLRAAGTMNP